MPANRRPRTLSRKQLPKRPVENRAIQSAAAAEERISELARLLGQLTFRKRLIEEDRNGFAQQIRILEKEAPPERVKQIRAGKVSRAGIVYNPWAELKKLPAELAEVNAEIAKVEGLQRQAIADAVAIKLGKLKDRTAERPQKQGPEVAGKRLRMPRTRKPMPAQEVRKRVRMVYSFRQFCFIQRFNNFYLDAPRIAMEKGLDKTHPGLLRTAELFRTRAVRRNILETVKDKAEMRQMYELYKLLRKKGFDNRALGFNWWI